MPMVACLNQHGIDAELWFENRPDHQGIISQTFVPQRHLGTDFTPNPLTFCRRLDQYRKQLRAARPTLRPAAARPRANDALMPGPAPTIRAV